MRSGHTNTHMYFHHVPGRLRIRSSQVKGNEREASSATAWLRSLPGVSSAEANVVTGSLTLRYDPSTTGCENLLTALKGAGYVSANFDSRPAPIVSAQSTFRSQLQSELATKVVKTLAVYAVEQAVTALITTLL